jgi:hypothetical protein
LKDRDRSIKSKIVIIRDYLITYFPHQSSLSVTSSLTTRLSLGERPVLAPESVANAPLDVTKDPFSYLIACSYNSTPNPKRKKKHQSYNFTLIMSTNYSRFLLCIIINNNVRKWHFIKKIIQLFILIIVRYDL